jgi:hypothetical protein
MAVLWIMKLYWLWLIIGILILYLSIFSNFSILGIIIGSVVTLFGLVARGVMKKDSLRRRIDRSL